MRRLVYFHPPDEDQLPPQPPPPLNLDEDSDSWWAGVKLCFVAVPLASALAATALSASIAFGYTQQTEDIVPQPPPTVVEDYYFAPPPRRDPWFAWLPTADEEIVPYLAVFAPDEDYWLPPFTQPSVWLAQAVWADEALPVVAPAPAVEEMILFRVGPIWIRID